MVKAVTLLAEPGIPATIKSDQSGSEDEDINAPSGPSTDASASHLDELKGVVAFSDVGSLLQGMRCAARSLQLAIHDAPKSETADDRL